MSIVYDNSKKGTLSYLSPFKLTDDEWKQIYNRFWKLGRHQARSLLNGNLKGSHTEDQEDIEQEMFQSMITAAMYHKRQCFIDYCFKSIRKHVKDENVLTKAKELENIWNKKTVKGMVRKKFGINQEKTLYKLVNQHIPQEVRPSPTDPFTFDQNFDKYCKNITWNRIKNIGRKITKERSLRSGMASLSSFNYLTSEKNDFDEEVS